MFRRILYSSLVDVSLPSGPGVNERSFLKDMLVRYDANLHAVIPRPVRGLPEELAGLDATLIRTWGSVRTKRGWSQANALGAFQLPCAIERFQPDLIVLRSGALAVPHYLLSRASGIPYVVKTAGDVTFQSFYGRSWIRRSLKGPNDRMFASLLHGALCIDVVSPSQRERVTRLHPNLGSRICVIDNGVDLNHFISGGRVAARERFGFAEKDFVVGYVGNLPMQRGGKEVIDVVASLTTRGNVRGLIVGDSGEADACRQHASASGVSDAVMVYGEADYGNVPELMACIDVGLSILQPRERGNSEQKVRQYLATGLCVVGTAGSNDFLRGQEFARIVQSADLDEVVGAVVSFIAEGRESIDGLGRKARSFAESTLSIAARNDQRVALWNEMGSRHRVGTGDNR